MVGGNGAKNIAHVLAKLPDGGVLKRSSLFCDPDEDEPAVSGALRPRQHLASFQAVDSFGNGSGLQVHSFCEFTNGNAVSVLWKKIEGHELRGAQTGFVEVIEVCGLYQLPNGKPRREKSRDFFIVNFPVHTLILLQHERGVAPVNEIALHLRRRAAGWPTLTLALNSRIRNSFGETEFLPS